MVNPIQKLVLLHSGSNRIRSYLTSELNIESEKLSTVNRITTASKIKDDKLYEIRENGELVLSRQLHQQVVQSILESKPSTPIPESQLPPTAVPDGQSLPAPAADVQSSVEQKEKEYELESTNQIAEFTVQEQKVHNTLIHASDILERVFNRRTGLTSWILYWSLSGTGLVKGWDGDFSEIRKILKSPGFSKKLAKYYLASDDKKDEVLDSEFKENNVEKRLASLFVRVRKVANLLPSVFVEWFPKTFAVQNILMPFLESVTRGTSAGTFFSAVRLINPFVDEFINSCPSLCGDEISLIKANSTVDSDEVNKEQELNLSRVKIDENNNVVVSEIQLTNFDREMLDMTNVRDLISSAFGRLTRPRNASGLFFTILWKALGYSGYKPEATEPDRKGKWFEKEVVQSELLATKLMEHLKEIQNKDNVPISEALSVKGLDETPKEKYTANTLLSVLSIVKNLPDDVINKWPRMFGIVYSFADLGLPILGKILGDKSFIGKIVDWVQLIAPFFKEVFLDIIASAFEEAQIVKAVVKKYENTLFKGLPKNEVSLSKQLINLLDSAKNVIDSIKGRFAPDVKTAPEG